MYTNIKHKACYITYYTSYVISQNRYNDRKWFKVIKSGDYSYRQRIALLQISKVTE